MSLFQQLESVLLYSQTPLVELLSFFEEIDFPRLFPELDALISCPQKESHHPEGNVFVHTLLVLHEGVKYREFIPADWQKAFMFGLLLHDVGKPVTTDPVKLTAYSHDSVGGPIAEAIMERLTSESDLIEKVRLIVVNHMKPVLYTKQGSKLKAWRKVHKCCPLDILAYVSVADCDGRGERMEKLGLRQACFIRSMEMLAKINTEEKLHANWRLGRGDHDRSQGTSLG